MPGIAISHQNISIVYVHLRYYEDAQEHLQHAMTLNRKLGIRAGHARCLLDLLGPGERTYQIACVLTNLATSYQAARNNQAAARASQEALSILLALRHPDIDQVITRLSDAGIPVH